MITNQQDSDSNNSVKKTKPGLNPDAESFFSKKAEVPTASAVHETLTNGDVKADDVGGGLSSHDSPVSASPPVLSRESFDPGLDAPQAESTGIDLLQSTDSGFGPPQPQDPEADPSRVVTNSGMETAETEESVEALASAEGAEGSSVQGAEASIPSKDLDSQSQNAVSLAVVENGLGADDQESAEEGAKASGTAEESSRLSISPELRKQLLHQLEYYFSRDNLEQDHYLQSQMDDDQYVSITTIANFNQVVKLTRDYNLIVEVLRGSSHVQVDSTGTKVRPKYNRSVLMLREIPQDTPKSEVEALFNHEKCPKVASCEFAHNGYWYIKFKTDKEAIEAYLFLREYEVKFKDKPVMARIKANSLVRSVGGSHHFAHGNMMTGNQQQPQQNGPMPFIPQQPPTQYPVMAGPIQQYIGQPQVQQAVPFQLFNFPSVHNVLPQWTATNTAPHFLDPGTMLAINGYQAAGIKSNNHFSRNIYHPLRSNNRGMGKPHRTQSLSTEKASDARPMDRPHLHNPSAARSNPRSNNHNPIDFRSQSLPSGRSRSEGAPSSGPLNSPAAAAVSAAPMPLVSAERGQNSMAVLPGSRTESSVTVPHARRGGNYRKPRRGDEGAKNSRSHPPVLGSKEPHFDLQATSFPPLPGSLNNSSAGEASDGSRLSDVVKGATGASRSASEMDESVKPIASASATVSTTGAPVSTTVQHKCSIISSVANVTPSVSARGATASTGIKENKMASSSGVSPAAEPACDKATAIVVESSKHSPKTSKAMGQAASPAAPKAVSEAHTLPAKSATICSSTQVKPTTVSASVVSAVHSVPVSAPQGATPVKLSYAQMVARKQAESSVKASSVENGASSQASPAAAAVVCSQPEPSAVSPAASASASSRPSSAISRPSPREYPRRDYEPREQRFQGSRRTREFRDNRQPRFEPRRSDRDVKVPTK